MVFGLINFLMGGKKEAKTPKTGAINTPTVAANTAEVQPAQVQQAGAQIPDGVNTTTPNAATPAKVVAEAGAVKPAAGVQFVDSKAGAQPAARGSAHAGGKKSISDVIHKLHDELGESRERVTELVTDIKKVENTVNEIGHRLDTLEEAKAVTDEKLAEVDENMTKFLSLYELINNQYNPFIDKDSVGAPHLDAKAAIAAAGGDSESHQSSVHAGSSPFDKPDFSSSKKVDVSGESDFDSVLLELDTLDIEEAAADAVPLTKLKNNTNSLVVILSWLEYMIKRVGIEETRNSLRYYTEVLRWTTPEVFFDLDKYLRGMKDKKSGGEADTLGVKDHIVSLYFISKLNEKKLDDKLTSAVLQIIKK